MYLSNQSDSYTYYSRDGQQRHTQSPFLCLIQPDDGEIYGKEKIRAVVRQVALEQVGHFMMGTARIGNDSYTVSGAYGGDGLPFGIAPDVWDRFGVPLPDRLVDAWSNGGGHNSAGSERELMDQWARENYDRLTP